MLRNFSRTIQTSTFLLLITAASAEESSPGPWLKQHALEVNEAEKEEKSELLWFNATTLSLEDKPFEDTVTSFSRLSQKHKDMVTSAVWRLGMHSTGVTVRFVSDSPEIWATWNNNEPMVHMAYTGSGGLDLYSRENDKWEFFGMARPTTSSKSLAQFRPARQLENESERREYLVFLPTYSQVDFLRIGIKPGKSIAPAPDRYADAKPIVFYGTSITQGGCASRSGMAHPAIIRRWLDRPVYNLGFSGAGKCEPAMAEILAEIPAAVYIVETVSNMTPDMITDRVVPFMKLLREKRPDSPIIMVESPNVEREPGSNEAYETAYQQLVEENFPGLFYIQGEKLYQGRENPTVDGSHPTDLGFYEMALAYEKELKAILEEVDTEQN